MVNILMLIFLILVNAFFAGSEIALISVNKNKLVMSAEEGDKKAKVVLKLVEKPTRMLSMIQIGVTLSGFLNSVFAADSFSDPLATIFFSALPGVSMELWRTVSMIVITIVLTFLTLVFGELVPKRIAMHFPEPFARKVAYPISVLNAFFSPFVSFLTLCTNLMLTLFGIDPNKNDESASEEEIRMMIASSSGDGTIRETEREMIDNIFEFDDTTIDEVMTHRTEINAINVESNFEEVLDYVNHVASSRIPVYEEDLDHIIGVLHVKDLLRSLSNKQEFYLRNLLREVIFVPDSQPIEKLFNKLKSENRHIAVVIDEYGGTCGLITMEDLLEEIVGEVFDEYDEVPFSYKQLDSNKYIMDGSMELDEVEKVLRVEMPVDDYDTLNGFIISQIGRLPDENDKASFEYESYTFKIVEVEDKVVEKVIVEKTQTETSTE